MIFIGALELDWKVRRLIGTVVSWFVEGSVPMVGRDAPTYMSYVSKLLQLSRVNEGRCVDTRSLFK